MFVILYTLTNKNMKSYVYQFVDRFPPSEPLNYTDVLTFIQELQDQQYLKDNNL